jgi:hypothetical protein
MIDYTPIRCSRCAQWKWVHAVEFVEHYGPQSEYFKKYGGPCRKFCKDNLDLIEDLAIERKII